MSWAALLSMRAAIHACSSRCQSLRSARQSVHRAWLIAAGLGVGASASIEAAMARTSFNRRIASARSCATGSAAAICAACMIERSSSHASSHAARYRIPPIAQVSFSVRLRTMWSTASNATRRSIDEADEAGEADEADEADEAASSDGGP
jgi:hypothetical protein